jgi:predicted KAP-like P-loop ATPase
MEGMLRKAAIDNNLKGVFSADKPLENPENDKLGYARFAEHLAKSIIEISPAEGYVVSINGTWGLGKTTVLNFIQHYLEF